MVVFFVSIIGCGFNDPSRGFLQAWGKPVFRTDNPELWAPDWDEPVNADPKSFKSIFAPKTTEVAFHYACDAKKVFIGLRKLVYELEGAAPSTFKVLDPLGHFAVDVNNVYYLGFQLHDVDAASFEVVGKHYGKDKNSVFFGHTRVVEAEPQSFVVLSEGESSLVRSRSSGPGPFRKVENHETRNVDKFSGFWAKDRQFCFHHSRKIEDADSVSFRVIGQTTAEDKKWRWSEEGRNVLRRFELNPSSLKPGSTLPSPPSP